MQGEKDEVDSYPSLWKKFKVFTYYTDVDNDGVADECDNCIHKRNNKQVKTCSTYKSSCKINSYKFEGETVRIREV